MAIRTRIVTFPEKKSSLLRNGYLNTFGVEVEYADVAKTVKFMSVAKNLKTHAGHILMPADPVALRDIAEFLIKTAIIIEEQIDE